MASDLTAASRTEVAPSRLSRALIAALRIGLALLWMQNAAWKKPPDFDTLRFFTGWAVEHEVFAPYAWLVENLVLPNFGFFGWSVLLVEAALGGFLLVGLATRLWALIGVAQTIAIMLSVYNEPSEWHWSYFLMLLAHLAVFAVAAGRYAGLDARLGWGWPRSGTPAGPFVRAGTVTSGVTGRPDRAVVTLGLVSIVSAAFVFVRGDVEFVQIRSGGVAVALVLGALVCAAGWLANRWLTVTGGIAFLLAAVLQLVLLAPRGQGGFLGGDGSTFSLWLGLGAGLLALGLAAGRPPARPGDRGT
jgi:thiosulfate dehydrogenase [quinone] large subunit